MKTTKERRKERQDDKFRVQFHSEERVEFFRDLPCEVTGLTRSGASFGRVVNAHTEGGGTGRKGPYTSIVPLKWNVHTDFDEMPNEKFEAKYRRTKRSIRKRAPYYHQMWLEHLETAA